MTSSIQFDEMLLEQRQSAVEADLHECLEIGKLGIQKRVRHCLPVPRISSWIRRFQISPILHGLAREASV